jgi:hypothetical protein
LSLDQVANALMSGGIALAVGVSGRNATVSRGSGVPPHMRPCPPAYVG